MYKYVFWVFQKCRHVFPMSLCCNLVTFQNLRHAEITIYPSQTDCKLKPTSFGKDHCCIIRRDFHYKMCVYVRWADSERNKTLAIISQLSPRGLTSAPMRLREAQVRLSRPRVLWFTRDAGETWPLACSLSLTAALHQSYTRTADLHQRCASLALHLIKVLA